MYAWAKTKQKTQVADIEKLVKTRAVKYSMCIDTAVALEYWLIQAYEAVNIGFDLQRVIPRTEPPVAGRAEHRKDCPMKQDT